MKEKKLKSEKNLSSSEVSTLPKSKHVSFSVTENHLPTNKKMRKHFLSNVGVVYSAKIFVFHQQPHFKHTSRKFHKTIRGQELHI
jgi:hypothetical protein